MRPLLLIACLLLSNFCFGEEKEKNWKSLFDGKSLKGWKVTNFGGQGEVTIKDGAIVMDFGSEITGITYAGKQKLPKSNYEISLEAQRVDGGDFFCGLTFPVKDDHASLIVGGWAGAVVGISSIDGKDASENETTTRMNFNKGQWYQIRLRVTDEKLQTWIDDKPVVDVKIKDRKISTRPEVDLSKPLGISCWQTRAALRKIRLRTLKD